VKEMCFVKKVTNQKSLKVSLTCNWNKVNAAVLTKSL
jgi:hypothetical protein